MQNTYISMIIHLVMKETTQDNINLMGSYLRYEKKNTEITHI